MKWTGKTLRITFIQESLGSVISVFHIYCFLKKVRIGMISGKNNDTFCNFKNL